MATRALNFTRRIRIIKLQTRGLLSFVRERGCQGYSGGLWKTKWVLAFCAAAVVASSAATTFNTLASFNGSNGTSPSYAPLVQGPNGNLYGTTYGGGANGYGTIFQISTAGALSTLHSFDNSDGANPCAGVIVANDGNLYGTTSAGGANGYGTVFRITAGGTLTTLHSFDLTDGAYPCAGLVQMLTGYFYGTTPQGGANGYGTIFTLNGGTFTTVHSFDLTDGSGPYNLFFPYPGLVTITWGDLYGTTKSGGANGDGTVFKISAANTITTYHSFDVTDGLSPYAGLVQATNGSFYGTTYSGGANGNGTVFQMTPSGALTTLHNFAVTDGENPEAALIQATDGNLYGTTYSGGAGYGTIFQMTLKGALTTLYSFAATDGNCPQAALFQATDGNFYGTTYSGGANGDGTVFKLSEGLGPFVQTVPSYGKVGAKEIILGNNLTGATSVSFNGTAATFTVVSASEITATLPAGAITGAVTVTTPSGTLNGSVIYRVVPQVTGFSPPSGPAGTPVTVTGISLTQVNQVSVGGVGATSFTVNSDTQLTVTVPTGARTGKIGVGTPGGEASSPTNFTVP